MKAERDGLKGSKRKKNRKEDGVVCFFVRMCVYILQPVM